MEENERMTSWLVAFALVGGASLPSPSGGGIEIRPGTMVEFGNAAACARVLSARDTFVQAMSPFDRSARLKTDKDVSEAEYLGFAARQVEMPAARGKTAGERGLSVHAVGQVDRFGRRAQALREELPQSRARDAEAATVAFTAQPRRPGLLLGGKLEPGCAHDSRRRIEPRRHDVDCGWNRHARSLVR